MAKGTKKTDVPKEDVPKVDTRERILRVGDGSQANPARPERKLKKGETIVGAERKDGKVYFIVESE